uniref:Neoverrucotoxin subunit alpha-like n=1 Tax=Acanthochromis polyacanthus TaxID=80966 RepID=A0A3Q1G3H6_9TELE
MASSPIEVGALGRPFSLGMLYDAQKDKLYTGLTLWDKETIEENRNEFSQQSSEFEVTTSDSIESKSSLLSVEASVKASFLCGLIQIGGSAKYLNDKKKFKNQSRVTLQYKATTKYQHLSMSHQEAKNKQTVIPDNTSATHVVTGILYGANAFFVFDSEKLEASSVHTTEAGMQAMIKKIPSFDFEAKVDTKLTNEEKSLAQKFSCKFYGDFILESNPATFEDAVKTYVQLPKMLGEKEKTGVPLKATLTPLKNFDFTVNELKGEICMRLLRKAQDTLEGMNEIEMRCNDSLDDKVVENFPQIYKSLRRFHDLCSDYTDVLQRVMAKKFPAIRAGKEDDVSLEKLFDDRQKSPFSQNNLSTWLEEKEKEINIIGSHVQIMQASVIRAPGADHVLCFVFTALESDDPHLEQMADYLCSCEAGSAKNVTPPTQEQWYSSQEVLTRMREKAKTFHDLTKGLGSNSSFRFLVAAVPNSKFKGATIHHYRDGVLITDDFSKPNIPDVTTVTNRTDLLWYACDLTLDEDTASYWLTLSDENKKATCGKQQSYSNLPQRFDPRPQVLCKEGLTGRHYWEVEWSKGSPNEVGVGITYKRIERKGEGKTSGIGSNSISWFFGETNTLLNAWHDGKVWSGSVPHSGYSRVGVYLDWPKGTLSFYRVSSNSLYHLYTFHSEFREPVYPGFYIYRLVHLQKKMLL